jgi:uncharacterized protein
MDFEWDEAKRHANLAKHGVDFEVAALIFAGPVFEAKDERKDYGEERFIAVGRIGEGGYVVVFTRSGGTIRLISARRAGRRDRRKLAAGLAGGT